MMEGRTGGEEERRGQGRGEEESINEAREIRTVQ